MIETRLEPLSDHDDTELRTWFTKSAFPLLLKLLDSKIKEQQSIASNQVMNDTEGYFARANETLTKARNFQIAKDIITQIAREPGKHSLVKLQ